MTKTTIELIEKWTKDGKGHAFLSERYCINKHGTRFDLPIPKEAPMINYLETKNAN